MSSLNSLYIKTDVLEKLAATAKKKNLKGIDLTISIADEGNNYGQNVSAFISQSKEDREAGKQKAYVGNGNTFWTDGKISTIRKEKQQSSNPLMSDDEDDFF